MDTMAGFEHLLQSCDVGDMLDDIASADPPAYLHRCFAEACSSPTLSWSRIQQLALCAMVLDSILNNRDYEGLEPELLSDWRVHFSRACSPIRDLAVEALRRAGTMPAVPADAAPELAELEHRLGAA
ncbi:MAG: hypothetical protein ABSC32_01105 [Steroidobacteraceae bacterium]|jgi:hypothetical protein